MKRHSIKTRVTFWYVCFLIVLTILLLFTLLYSSNYLTQKNVKGDLAALVERGARDVKIKDNQLSINHNMISYQDGISLLVYGENNFIITGNLPGGAPPEIPFIPDQVRKIEYQGHSFYVCDYLIDDLETEDIWIRGITAADLDATDPAIVSIIRIFFILLPLLIIFASVGGYYLTKRAFRPVARITETVDKIQAGKDLSKRVGIPLEKAGKDEIYDLSATFDQMLDRLEASFLAEKQFSDNASHELRTPVSVIIAQCEYALKENTSDEEKQTALEVSLKQAQKMSGLVAQLLTLARADRGAGKLVLEEINLSELLDIVCMEQELIAEKKRITILREIEPDLISIVDQTLMMRLFINLLSNSIQYGIEGGTTRVSLSAKEDHIILTVEDNGIGIASEHLPRIWDRFYQVHSSRSSDSLGLGLSMVKWITEAHNGMIEVTSELEKGTVFTLTLPYRKEHQYEQ